jgi:ceramide glucosyltransferase
MMDSLRFVCLSAFSLTIIDLFLLSLCLSACWFYCYAIYAAITFFCRSHLIAQEIQPGVSILKPICGLDDEAYENLASFCQQDYPEYQIIFAVRNAQDPGIEVVQKIIYDFPCLDIQLVVSEITIGTNLKVSNLANATALAKYEILVIADSDIRVGRDYLRRIIQPLQDSSVGVVTCPYRSRARGYTTILEALGSATEFHAGVLVGRQLEDIKFALGSTIVIRKQVLEVIGGFRAIADYLEDDFQLGYLPTLSGYKVVLSDYVVEHVLTTSTITDSIQRQIRWARGTRVSRPLGYIGLIFTHGTVSSLLFVIATGGSWLGWVGLGLTWSTRLVMAWVIGVWWLQDPTTKKFLWLIPVRDLMSFALWCYSSLGNTIKWHGQTLRLTKDGQLVGGELQT